MVWKLNWKLNDLKMLKMIWKCFDLFYISAVYKQRLGILTVKVNVG